MIFRTSKAIVLFISLALRVFSQATNESNSAILSVIAMDERGDPIKNWTLLVTGDGFRYEASFQGAEAHIPLPFGTYQMEGLTQGMVARNKSVVIRQTSTQTVLPFAPKPMDDDGAWMVEGRIVGIPVSTGRTVLVRLIPLFLDEIAEAPIKADGTFVVSVSRMGDYKLWIVGDRRRLVEVDVKIEQQPKTILIPTIRISPKP